MQIDGGTVRYGLASALPSTADVIFNTTSGTATLDLNNLSGTIASPTFGGASGTTAAVTTGTSTLTLGGNVTYDATNNPNGATISGLLDLGVATCTFTIGDSTGAADDLSVSAAISGSVGLIKDGGGIMRLTAANTAFTGAATVNAGTLTAEAGTTNANSAVGSGTSTVSVTGTGTALKFGTVSQTLGSLTIGAGSTVTFTSGQAFFSGGGKGPGGGAVVPKPGTLGLLLVGALGVLRHRRHQA